MLNIFLKVLCRIWLNCRELVNLRGGLIDIVSGEGPRFGLNKIKSFRARHCHLRLLAIQFFFKLALLTLELLSSHWLVDLGRKGVLSGQRFLGRVVLLAIMVFLHSARHASTAVANLSIFINALLTFLILFFHLLLVDKNRAGLGNRVGCKIRPPTFRIELR